MSEVIAQAAQAAVESSSQGAIQNADAQKAIPPGSFEAKPGGEAPAAVADKETTGNPKEDYAERIAQMARRERRLQEESRGTLAKLKEAEARLARLKDAPESVLEELGWSAEKYLERLATGETPKPTVDDEVKGLKAELEKFKQMAEEKEASLKAQEAEKAVAQYRNSLNTVVDKDPDRYEAIRELDERDLVWATAQAVFERTKQIPDPAKVADAVEKELRLKLDKSFKMKAFADRLKPTSSSASEDTSQQTYGGTTLTAQTTAATQPPSGDRLTDDQRLERAMGMLKFK